MPGSPNNSSKSEQDDRESLPSRATARVVPTIHGLGKPIRCIVGTTLAVELAP